MRYKSLLAATGLLASGLAFAAPAANAAPASATTAAAGTCTPYLPAKLVVNAKRVDIKVRAAANCNSAGMVHAAWQGVQPNDPVKEGFSFPDEDSNNPVAGVTYLTLFDDSTPIGRLDWTGHGATNPSGIALTPFTTTTKFDSWANVLTAKSGSTVTVTAQIGYYYSKADRYIRWANKTGILQFAENGSKVWHNLSSFRVNSNGNYTVKYNPGKVRQYRLYVYDSPTVWDKLSATKTQ